MKDLQRLQNIAAMYRAGGKKIVFTNACFDILHSGHINYLNRARELGDVLIVGVNTDESVKRIKGDQRPINSLYDRIEVLAGLSAVNHIISFGDETEDTASSIIQRLLPDVFVKGQDYKRDSLPEASILAEMGGEVILLPLLQDKSTTNVIERVLVKATVKKADLTRA